MCYDNEPLPVARDRSESQAHVVKIVAEMARQKFDPFSFCLDVVKTLMAEIIETVRNLLLCGDSEIAYLSTKCSRSRQL